MEEIGLKPNIGIINALLRITMGLTMLSWVTAKFVKHPRRDSYLIVAILGGMKVGEGITRFCPVTAVYNNYTANQNQDEHGTNFNEAVQKEMGNQL
jgi:hypothetical protein